MIWLVVGALIRVSPHVDAGRQVTLDELFRSAERDCSNGDRARGAMEYDQFFALARSGSQAEEALFEGGKCQVTPNESITRWQRLIELNPNSRFAEDAKGILANALLSVHRYEEAGILWRDWQRGVEWSPDVASASSRVRRLIQAAQYFGLAKDTPDQEAVLKEVLGATANGADADAVFESQVVAAEQLGFLYQNLGDSERARASYEDALRRYHEHPLASRDTLESVAAARISLAVLQTISPPCKGADSCAAAFRQSLETLAAVGQERHPLAALASLERARILLKLAGMAEGVQRRQYAAEAQKDCALAIGWAERTPRAGDWGNSAEIVLKQVDAMAK